MKKGDQSPGMSPLLIGNLPIHEQPSSIGFFKPALVRRTEPKKISLLISAFTEENKNFFVS